MMLITTGAEVFRISVGLFWGAYHFGVRGNPKGQADHFLSVVNPGSTDLLVLDFEPNPREGTIALGEAETFVTRVQEQTGRFPVLYSGQAFLREKLGNRTDTITELFLVDRSVFIAATRASARFRNLQIMAIHDKCWPTTTSSTRHWALR